MTLNLGHGRARDWAKILQTGAQARSNLTRIAKVLERERPHVVALQEVDRNSFWNGRFDHGAYLAEQANYPHHFGGCHHVSSYLDYGTALLSTLDMNDRASVKFNQALARPRKGFVVSSIRWPAVPGVEVDFVSLHLDFLRPQKRRSEIAKLIETLKGRPNPKIIMGDFNTGFRQELMLTHLAAELDLHAWEPESEQHITFPSLRRRLDWVLVSKKFHFAGHRVLEDPLSDHQAVIAELELKTA